MCYVNDISLLLCRETVCQASVLLLLWLSAVMEIPVLNACLLELCTSIHGIFCSQRKKERSREKKKKISTVLLFSVHTNTKDSCDLYTKVLAMWTNTLVHSNYNNRLNKSNAFFLLSKIHQQLLDEERKQLAVISQ